MALCGRLARRVPTTTGQFRSIAPSVSARSFTSRTARPLTSLRAKGESAATYRQLRAFTKVSATFNQTQEAPNAQAYLNSGVIAGARNLVDVKKVLVIGSGGLSIGQAGEFDYSGMSYLGAHQKKICSLTDSTCRFSSTEGSQGGWRQVGPHQPQYCDYPDIARARR